MRYSASLEELTPQPDGIEQLVDFSEHSDTDLASALAQLPSDSTLGLRLSASSLSRELAESLPASCRSLWITSCSRSSVEQIREFLEEMELNLLRLDFAHAIPQTLHSIGDTCGHVKHLEISAMEPIDPLMVDKVIMGINKIDAQTRHLILGGQAGAGIATSTARINDIGVVELTRARSLPGPVRVHG